MKKYNCQGKWYSFHLAKMFSPCRKNYMGIKITFTTVFVKKGTRIKGLVVSFKYLMESYQVLIREMKLPLPPEPDRFLYLLRRLSPLDWGPWQIFTSHAFLGSIPDLHVPPLRMLFLLFLAREASFRFDPFSIDLEKKSPLGASALSRGRLQASTTGQRAEKAPTGRRSLPSFYFTTDNAHSPK